MKKIIVVLMIICLTFCVVCATAPGVIEAVITDSTITIETLPLNDSLDNPLLSYNDRTYIAVRDMAAILNKDVSWNEEQNTIELVNHRYPVDEYVVDDYDMALTIGRTVIKMFFPDDVTDKTVYQTWFCELDCDGSRPYYEVCAKFNESGSNELVDVWDVEWDVTVEIDAHSGDVLRITKYDGKKQTVIYPVEH